ncbi:MAG: PQ-loop domain-containing transporter [Candidatus Micrarchaeaceae archaeon]
MQELYYVLGLIASIIVTVAYVPQVIKTARTKHTSDLSLKWLAFLSSGLVLYTIYGFAIASQPVVISSAAGAALVIILLLYKLRYS